MDIQPVVGRTHTDLYKTRGRLTNIGGKGGLNLTFFSANGYSYIQLGILVVGLLVWTLPLTALGIPFLDWGGLTLLIHLGPPLGLAWAADRPMPHGKTFAQWVTTRYRRAVQEKPLYVAGHPATPTRVTVNGHVWTPSKEGLRD